MTDGGPRGRPCQPDVSGTNLERDTGFWTCKELLPLSCLYEGPDGGESGYPDTELNHHSFNKSAFSSFFFTKSVRTSLPTPVMELKIQFLKGFRPGLLSKIIESIKPNFPS